MKELVAYARNDGERERSLSTHVRKFEITVTYPVSLRASEESLSVELSNQKGGFRLLKAIHFP
jgi:hypothetical protein